MKSTLRMARSYWISPHLRLYLESNLDNYKAARQMRHEDMWFLFFIPRLQRYFPEHDYLDVYELAMFRRVRSHCLCRDIF